MAPEVGSKWKKRNGCAYVVASVVTEATRPYAVLTLLTERLARVGSRVKFHHRELQMSLRRFPTYFRPLDEEGWSERKPDYRKRSRATVAPPADYLERLKQAISYDPETGLLTWTVDRSRVKAGTRAGVLTPLGYYRLRFEGRDLLAQHVAWVFIHGVWPTLDLDHIDGVRLNNRPENLREATNEQNHRNRGPLGGRSRFKCVSFAKGRWRAMLARQYLGSFDTEEEAARAHDRAALARDPVFAFTNFPKSDYADDA